jgi:hypothetical protein
LRLRTAGYMVLGLGCGVGTVLTGVGLSLSLGNMCFFNCSGKDSSASDAGIALLATGGTLIAAGLVVGIAMAVDGSQQLKALQERAKALGVSVAATPRGASMGWRLRF